MIHGLCITITITIPFSSVHPRMLHVRQTVKESTLILCAHVLIVVVYLDLSVVFGQVPNF